MPTTSPQHPPLSPRRPPPRTQTRIKPSDRCPECGTPRPIKKGTRAKKFEVIQRYQCRNKKCGANFTAAPGTLKNKTYSLATVLAAITSYNRGAPLKDIASKIRAKTGSAIALSTIEAWLDDYL